MPSQQEEQQRMSRLYVFGAIGGAVVGILSAYLFEKEAKESTSLDEEQRDIPPTAFLGLALSIIGVVRQIAETPRRKR